MKIFDVLLGRSKPVKPTLDNLFRLPAALVTIQSSLNSFPNGVAGVCIKSTDSASFVAALGDIEALCKDKDQDFKSVEDSYGYRWMIVSSNDFEELVTKVHMVNTTVSDSGWGPQLLCSVFSFKGDQSSLQNPNDVIFYLIYLYKRGTFYPFVPKGAETRDNAKELHIKTVLEEDLPLEQDYSRWFPLWGIPL